MEIYISNLERRQDKESLKRLLTPTLKRVDVHTFNVHKQVQKPYAFLTIADSVKAQKFLQHVAASHVNLDVALSRARFAPSKKGVPDPFLIGVLQKEEKDRQTRLKAAQAKKPRSRKDHRHDEEEDEDRPRALTFTGIKCGRWEDRHGSIVFVPFWNHDKMGNVTADRRSVTMKIYGETFGEVKSYRVVMDAWIIQSIAVSKDDKGLVSVIFSLNIAPAIYEDEDADVRPSNPAPENPTQKIRTTNIAGGDRQVFGCCLAWRIWLLDRSEMHYILDSYAWSHLPLVPIDINPPDQPSLNFQKEVDKLQTLVRQAAFSFTVQFQIQALWSNAILSPKEVRKLVPAMTVIRDKLNESCLGDILRRLLSELLITGPETKVKESGPDRAIQIMNRMWRVGQATAKEDSPSRRRGDDILVHRVMVTPTGTYLYGPNEEASNRILRRYKGNEDCFVRVSFVDEHGEKVYFDRETSNDRIFGSRFLDVLQNGLGIANEHFEFLGFSHSSLRAQSCWFMRPFNDGSRLLTAAMVVEWIGDFSMIRCPAKCAARIGQAFTESRRAVKIDPQYVTVVSDTKKGDYTFTDGCGTMSRWVWKTLGTKVPAHLQATSYQIRYQGAKGMISLDTSLQGRQMRLRESMVKFTGSLSNDIEICGSNNRPLPFRLNRQIIKILEDRGVEDDVFESVQARAIEELQRSVSSAEAAVDFVCSSLTDTATGLPGLLRSLLEMDIDATEDKFLRDILGALLQIQLREIKYRARIRVPEAVTLYGICDETGYLDDNQVYVTFFDVDQQEDVSLTGPVSVTRSPALHPGDIQVVQAIEIPDDSPLHGQRNCIVFSRKGERDLPSMLSGGDLDGDLYNVIFHDGLAPRRPASPADYSPASPINIGRPVTAKDITEFFIDFMQNDQLARIATLHQVFADQEEKGTFSDKCLKLAALHSTAVDFSKSGVRVDLKAIPRASAFKPDFMAPSASTKVEEGIKRPEDLNLELGDSRGVRYYESPGIIGKLYRAIDEDEFFQNLEDDDISLFSRDGRDDVLMKLWRELAPRAMNVNWKKYAGTARQIKERYEYSLQDSMVSYAARRSDYATEKEVFVGTIIGRTGAGSKRQREQSEQMKEGFNREVREVVARIRGKEDDRDVDRHSESDPNPDPDLALALALACLECSLTISKVRLAGHTIELRSFGWIAAAVCVREFNKAEDDWYDYAY